MYSPHVMPVLLDVSFTVTPSAAAGVSSLTGTGVSAVYMASSTTSTDPIFEPADGIIHMKLTDNFSKLYGFSWSAQPTVTGSSISISGSSVLTQGVPYQIVTVGTSTTANWVAAGVPAGVTPAAGVVFIAKITGSGTGTGTVKALGVTNIGAIEVLGNPNLTTIAPTGVSNLGSWFVFQTLAPTSSSVTTVIPTAPTTGSVISMKLWLSNSSLTTGY